MKSSKNPFLLAIISSRPSEGFFGACYRVVGLSVAESGVGDAGLEKSEFRPARRTSRKDQHTNTDSNHRQRGLERNRVVAVGLGVLQLT